MFVFFNGKKSLRVSLLCGGLEDVYKKKGGGGAVKFFALTSKITHFVLFDFFGRGKAGLLYTSDSPDE